MAKRTLRRTRRARTLGLLLAVALWPLAAALGQDYEVKLHRPAKSGDKSHLSAVAQSSTKQTVKAADKVLTNDSEEFSVQCEAVETVLEVDGKGAPIKVSLAIEKCTRTQGKDTTEVVPKGTVAVFAMKDTDKVIEINGAPPGPEVQKALSLLVNVSRRDSATDDETFGTKDRKKVGDRWVGNAELMAKELSAEGMEAKKEAITSTFTLEKVVKAGEIECLQISGEFEAKGFKPPVPEGFTIEKSAFHARFGGKFPVDTSLAVPEVSMQGTATILMKGKPDPNGPEITAEGVVSRSLSERHSEMK